MAATPLTTLIARCRTLCRSRLRVQAVETIAKSKLLPVGLLVVSSAAETRSQTPQFRTDRHGDALPDGAIARLGTVRWRHGCMITALVYSPDGKKIAAVGGPRNISLWDAATGKELCHIPRIHETNGLAFCPDGKVIATTDNPDCYLWDAATGKQVRRFMGCRHGQASAALER